MRAEVENVPETKALTPCGKCSCIIMYKGDLCVFCDAASELLERLLSSYGVQSTAIKEVDFESRDECGCVIEDVLMLPTIKICDAKIIGLPDEQTLNDAVMRAIMKECFCD